MSYMLQIGRVKCARGELFGSRNVRGGNVLHSNQNWSPSGWVIQINSTLDRLETVYTNKQKQLSIIHASFPWIWGSCSLAMLVVTG